LYYKHHLCNKQLEVVLCRIFLPFYDFLYFSYFSLQNNTWEYLSDMENIGTEGTGRAFAKETNLFTSLVENGQEFRNQPEI